MNVARERDRARSEQMEREFLAEESEIVAARESARHLPVPLADAIMALLDALLPFRAGDGHLSTRVVGRHSPEVLALARAVLVIDQLWWRAKGWLVLTAILAVAAVIRVRSGRWPR